jgi:hypothetical protein
MSGPNAGAERAAAADRSGTIPLGLSKELQQKLAVLSGMSDVATEASIALLPFGDRALLATYRVIDQAPDADLAAAGWPSDFALTSTGRRVIALCAQQWPDCARDRPRENAIDASPDHEQLDNIFDGIFAADERPA